MNQLSMDRSDSLYVVALLSFVMSLCAFPLSLYVLPQVWLGWNYRIPDFLITLNLYLQDSTGLSEQLTGWIIFYILFGLGLLSGVLAHWITFHVRMDAKKKLMDDEDVSDSLVRLKQAKQHRSELFFLGLKGLFIFSVVFFVARIVEWVLSVHSN